MRRWRHYAWPLADAVGAVVGAHSLAQTAMVGTLRLFRQPAGAVSLFARWRGEGGGRGVDHPVAAGGAGAVFYQGVSDAPPLAKQPDAPHCSCGLPHRQWRFDFLHDYWGGLVFDGIAMKLFVWPYVYGLA